MNKIIFFFFLFLSFFVSLFVANIAFYLIYKKFFNKEVTFKKLFIKLFFYQLTILALLFFVPESHYLIDYLAKIIILIIACFFLFRTIVLKNEKCINFRKSIILFFIILIIFSFVSFLNNILDTLIPLPEDFNISFKDTLSCLIFSTYSSSDPKCANLILLKRVDIIKSNFFYNPLTIIGDILISEPDFYQNNHKDQIKNKNLEKIEDLSEVPIIYGPYCYVWDYITTEGFAYSVWNEKKELESYVRFKDSVYGPYEKVIGLTFNGDKYSFRYLENGKEYINESGKIYGPHENTWSDYFKNGGWQVKGYRDGFEDFIIFNDKHYGPFHNTLAGGYIATKGNYMYINIGDQSKRLDGFVPQTKLSDNLFGFEYKKEGKWYVNINDVIYGPYDEAFGIILSNNNFAFKYKKENSWYINFNGEEFISFETAPFTIHNNKLAYVYNQSEIGESSVFLSINNVIYGPYDGVKEVILNDNIFGFLYSQLGYYHVNINNTILGPYEDANDLELNENNFLFKYKKNDLWYVKLKDDLHGPYSEIHNLIISDYHYGFRYKDAGFWNINLDGKAYFGYDAIRGEIRFNKDNFAFSYFKDNNYYININNDIKGPYDGNLNIGSHAFVSLGGEENYLIIYNNPNQEKTCSVYLEKGKTD